MLNLIKKVCFPEETEQVSWWNIRKDIFQLLVSKVFFSALPSWALKAQSLWMQCWDLKELIGLLLYELWMNCEWILNSFFKNGGVQVGRLGFFCSPFFGRRSLLRTDKLAFWLASGVFGYGTWQWLPLKRHVPIKNHFSSFRLRLVCCWLRS